MGGLAHERRGQSHGPQHFARNSRAGQGREPVPVFGPAPNHATALDGVARPAPSIDEVRVQIVDERRMAYWERRVSARINEVFVGSRR